MSAPDTTLTAIRNKVRRITGRPSTNQISNSEIDFYVNTFYLYDLPEHVRNLPLKATYSFVTEPNIDTYDFDLSEWYTIDTPVYAAGYELQLYQSPQLFWALWPRLGYQQNLGSGDGTTGPFSTTLTGIPVLRGTTDINGITTPLVIVSSQDVNGNPLSGTDDGNGNIVGTFTGTINYITGAISVTSSTAVGNGNTIFVQSTPYAASRPQQIMFFDSQFVLRPVPDKAYIITMTAYKQPTALANASDNPLLKEWWQVLAMGAALKIFEDNGDQDQYASFKPIFDKYLTLIERRTIQQIKILQATTIYNLDSITNFGNYFPNT